MLTQILRRGFYVVIIAVILLPLAQPIIPMTTSAAPSETSVYTEDFTSYATKNYTDKAAWNIWNHSLNLEPIDITEQSNPKLAKAPNGNVIVVYQTFRVDNSDIHAQWLDAHGNPLRTTDVRVNSDEGTAEQQYPAVAVDMNNNATIVWMDARHGWWDIYAQRLDANGNRLWTTDFHVSTRSGTDQQQPSVAMDASGNAIIVWTGDYNGDYDYDIYAQRVNENGNRLWPADIRVDSASVTANQGDPTIAIDSGGNAVITWTDYRNGNPDIYGQRLNSSGNRLWAADVRVNSDTGTARQVDPVITIDTNSDAVVVWNDTRLGSGPSYVYAQRLNTNGNRLWTADVRVSYDTSTNPSVALDAGGNAVVVWEWGNNIYDICAQRLDTTGARLWATDVCLNSNSDAPRRNPGLVLDSNGNALIAWEDYRNGTWTSHVQQYSDLYAQQIDSNGNWLQSANERVDLGSGVANQFEPNMAMDANGNAIVVWVDDRNGNGDIYAQRFDAIGNRLWAADMRVNSDNSRTGQHDLAVTLDGSGNVVIAWRDNRNGEYQHDIRAQRLDANGNRLWATDMLVYSVANQWEQKDLNVAADIDGNTIVVWSYAKYGTGTGIDIYAQRLDTFGNQLWPTEVLVNSGGGTSDQRTPTIASEASGNAVIAWRDRRNSNDDIYAQRLGVNGTRLWAADVRVNSDSGGASQEYPAVQVNVNGNAIIVWDDNRDGYYDVYAQTLNTSGNRLWGTDALVNADSGTGSHDHPVVALDTIGNAVVAWNDARNGYPTPEIYAQRLNTNGNRLWAADARINSEGGQADLYSFPAAAMDANGNTMLIWQDSRNGNADLYSQKVNAVGNKLWLADLQLVYPDRFYFPSGVAQSRTIDTVAGDIRQATLTANYQLNGGRVEFALSNNGGTNWVTTTLGTATVFPTTGSDLRWRALLTGDPVWRNRSPIVTSLRIDYSTAVPYADDYEADDDCTQARPIASGGAAQTHTFHQQADADWTWFEVVTNTTYVVQATHTGANADLELALHDTCQHVVQNGDPSLGNDVRLVLEGLPAGRYYLKVTNAVPNVFGADTGYNLSVRFERPNGLAIIVAGRLKMSDALQPNINTAANRAYLTFLQRGFTRQNIQYLNVQTSQDVDNNGLQDDVDGLPTVDNVREAIQTWARQRGVALGVPLYVYMVDHGEVDRFHADVGQTVTAELLNLWLSNLEATTGADQITVILEACHSGSFIDQYLAFGSGAAEIAGPNRVIVSSTSSWASAWPLGNGILFSDAFWSGMREGRSVRASFQLGQQAAQQAGHVNCRPPVTPTAISGCQQPWLDDNGNGVPNETTDGALAEARGLVAPLGWEVPEVVAVIVNVPDAGGVGSIQAEVYDNGALSTVEALIIPPGYQPVIPGDGSLPPWNVPTVALTTAGNNLFGGQFNFTQRGFYRVLVYARDGQNNQSAPQAATVCVDCSYVFLPLVRK